MNQRAVRTTRCQTCFMHPSRCVCALIPRISSTTHLALVAHACELRKPTSTGRHAVNALENSALYVHGVVDAPLSLTALHEEGRRLLILFPSEGASVLTPAFVASDPRPVTLVVPEGNWGQASRIPKRVTGLMNVPHVTLAPGPASRWGIRQGTREGGLSTYEAIARAFSVLESAAVESALMRFFDVVAETTYAARGRRPQGLTGPSPLPASRGAPTDASLPER